MQSVPELITVDILEALVDLKSHPDVTTRGVAETSHGL
jgi:hypothetical protein